jgi:hypothetical protein
MTFSRIHEHSPDDDLITHCADPPLSHVLSGAEYSQKVVKLLNETVVKFGISVAREEVNNQERAYELVGHTIVRVPRLYRFFTDKQGLGYNCHGIRGNDFVPD